MLQIKSRYRPSPIASTANNEVDVADGKAPSNTSPSIEHADASHSPALEAITSQVIIERLQALERAMGPAFSGMPRRSLGMPDGRLSSTASLERMSNPPSYESPPPSWRS